jgi:hypothetical protein
VWFFLAQAQLPVLSGTSITREHYRSSLRPLIKVERSDRDLTSANIVAKRSDNKPVTISLNYRSANETEAVIRIGHLGNKDASVALKDAIAKVLFGE